MAKNNNGKKIRTNGTNPTNNAANNGSRPYFVIANVEGDIRRKGKATPELCAKYGKTPEEIKSLIARAYHGFEGKVRELTRALERNDAQYERRMATNIRNSADEAPEAQTVVVPQKTPLDNQREAVAEAQRDVANKVDELHKAEGELREATTAKATAQENMRKAREALNEAEDALMMAQSKKHTAEEKLRESRANCELQLAKLNEMKKKKLLHFSSVKDGIPDGQVLMSECDYAKLSDADKAKVTPVNTEDSTFTHYPDDFYMYPAKLGMEGYQSACAYALAYVKLILEDQDGVAVEMVCADETVKALATMQTA